MTAAGGDRGDNTARQNHVTRDIKQRGQCPGCDAIHDSDPNGGRTFSAPAADRQTDEERCRCTATDLHDRDCPTVAHLAALRGDLTDGVRRAKLRDALRVHHPIMRSETGPFAGCRCGQVRLGEDVIAHVVGELLAALDGEG